MKDQKKWAPPHKGMSRDTLVEQYDPFVRSVAAKVKETLSPEIEFNDLLSYGMIGLFEAADRFDIKFKASFSTYAYYRVRGAMYDGLRKMGWVNRTEYRRYRLERDANAYLSNVYEQGLGQSQVAPEDAEAEQLADAVEGLVAIFVVTVDAIDQLQEVDARPSAEVLLGQKEMHGLVQAALTELSEKEQTLLKAYYYKELTLEEAGRSMGLSKSWASRLHQRSIYKLSKILEKHLCDSEN